MHEIAVADFERQVLEDLAEIKTNMRWLLGNGKPGFIQVILHAAWDLPRNYRAIKFKT